MSHLQALKLPVSGVAVLDSLHPNPPANTLAVPLNESIPSLLLLTPTQLLTVICLDT